MITNERVPPLWCKQFPFKLVSAVFRLAGADWCGTSAFWQQNIYLFDAWEKKIEFCAQILYMKPVLPHNLNNNGIESKLGDGTIVAAFRFAFAKFTNGQRRKWNNWPVEFFD